MKVKYLILAVVIVLSASSSFGQAPKYSNEFLSVGTGARAFGMAHAVVATTTDVTSGYWNPAGLLTIEGDIEIAMMHSSYFAGIAKYDYGSIAAKIDATSTAGFTFLRFGVDDIPDTSELIDEEGNVNYDRIKSFSAADYGFLFSYGRKSKIEGLDYGANVKIIHRKVGDFAKAWGFGLDAGVKYKLKNWRFAAMGRDITSTFNAWSFSLSDRVKEVWTLTGNEIPENSLEVSLPRVLLGAARLFTINDDWTILPEIDLDITTDGKRNVLIKGNPFSIDPHLGFEVSYKGIAYLRGGVGNIQKEPAQEGGFVTTFQPNAGIGVVIKKRFSIDYALTDIGNVSGAPYSNVFSLKVNFTRAGPASATGY
ncbi:MAG: hypothetical protein KKA07_02610 [Bacteroidetes bacterium]|nr:hypothetical protein [Bacteroidota bacterium]MBU1717942.1 hypothetical protein [Bacteroidota bacterium]